MDHTKSNKKMFNPTVVKAQKEAQDRSRAVERRKEINEALKKGHSITISEPIVT